MNSKVSSADANWILEFQLQTWNMINYYQKENKMVDKQTCKSWL